jgi:hypothetical protein
MWARVWAGCHYSARFPLPLLWTLRRSFTPAWRAFRRMSEQESFTWVALFNDFSSRFDKDVSRLSRRDSERFTGSLHALGEAAARQWQELQGK